MVSFPPCVVRDIAKSFFNKGESAETLATKYECTRADILAAIHSHVEAELKEPAPSPLRPRCPCQEPLPSHAIEVEIDSSEESDLDSDSENSYFPTNKDDEEDDSTYVPDEDDEDDEDDSTYVPDSDEESETSDYTDDSSSDETDTSSEASLESEAEEPYIRHAMKMTFHRKYSNDDQEYYDQLVISPLEDHLFQVKFIYDRESIEHKTYLRSYFTATKDELFTYLKNVFKMVQFSRHPYDYIDMDINFFPSFTIYSSDLKKKSIQKFILRAVGDYVAEFIAPVTTA